MRILIINGPNLNLLGRREVEIYGDMSFDDYLAVLREEFSSISLEYFQSNVEGEIINALHNAMNKFDGIVLNAGGYSHTSVAIADAIRAIKTPVVEVHISNIHSREDYRHHTITGGAARGVITGFGLQSYRLALIAFKEGITQK